jgi:ATP-dependent DNA helicase RecG
MTPIDLIRKLAELRNLTAETEWVEFKCNNADHQKIGQYISALSNSAALCGKRHGYIVWGIEDATHALVGTSFKPRQQKVGNEELENWLSRLLNPRIDFTIHEFQSDGHSIVLFKIQAAISCPVRFEGEEFIRVGSYKKKLRDFPEKERRLWEILSSTQQDWSAQIVEGASWSSLDPEALEFARAQYKEKHPQLSQEIGSWDDATFLNKAKLCINGRVTTSALLLLGKDEASPLLVPAQAQITWVLQDEYNHPVDYQHFGLPFILASNKVLTRIRNLTIRHLPSGTLFPQELTQYDPQVIRETLHNCIAHQDYRQGGRVSLVERPGSLLFTNLGSFIPGTVEEMIQRDAPPAIYRNPFLANAMVNLNMIDTIGSGIKQMFSLQRRRNFPMPDYDLNAPSQVAVKITGQVLDENYTRVLMDNTNVSLMDVIALDKVQKKRPLSNEEFSRLKKLKLVEGRRPNVFVSANVAAATGNKAAYIKHRAFDKKHYKSLVMAYLNKFGEASRQDLDLLLLEKLSDALAVEQKKKFIENLLQGMKRERLIHPERQGRRVKWRISPPSSP